MPRDLDCKAGELGRCVLVHKLAIKSVKMHNNGWYLKKCGICYDCSDECIDNYSVRFSVFLQQYDWVAYKTDWSYDEIESRCKIYKYENCVGHIVYGIWVTDMNKYSDVSEVVLLDNENIRERNAFAQYDEGYYHIYDANDHPSYAELYKPDLSKTNKDILADYEYAVEALKKIEE